MTKTQATAAAVLLVATPIVAYRIYWEGLITELAERFPGVHKKDIRKAYRKMMMTALSDSGPDTTEMTTEQMDAYFLDLVAEQLSK